MDEIKILYPRVASNIKAVEAAATQINGAQFTMVPGATKSRALEAFGSLMEDFTFLQSEWCTALTRDANKALDAVGVFNKADYLRKKLFED